MLHVIVGAGRDRVDVGPAEAMHCGSCRRVTPCRLFLDYEYSHLWFLFGKVDQKSYRCVCQGCGRESAAPAAEVERRLEAIPIPFMRRWGFYLLAGALGFLLAAACVVAGILDHYGVIDIRRAIQAFLADLGFIDPP